MTWGYTPHIPDDVRLSEVAFGGGHVVGRTLDGEVHTWGFNDYGQAVTPRGLAPPVALSAGPIHLVALGTDGSVTAWGADDYGGAADFPMDLDGVSQIATGWDLSIALLADGTVVSWGADYYDQRPPEGLSGVVQVDAYDEFSAALFEDGHAETYGWIAPPAPVSTDIVQISTGGYHTLALREDGTLEVAAYPNTEPPMPPEGLSGIVQISAGEDHALALLADGTVVGWGDAAAATPPEGLSDVVQVSAGWGHSLALQADGTVVGWGSHGSGQITVPEGLVASFVVAGMGYSAAVSGAPPVANAPDALPLAMALHAPMPNPATGPVTLRYDLATSGPLLLDVLDLQGRRLATLAEGTRPPGSHEVTWDPGALAAGVYVVRLRAGGTMQARRVTIAR